MVLQRWRESLYADPTQEELDWAMAQIHQEFKNNDEYWREFSGYRDPDDDSDDGRHRALADALEEPRSPLSGLSFATVDVTDGYLQVPLSEADDSALFLARMDRQDMHIIRSIYPPPVLPPIASDASSNGDEHSLSTAATDDESATTVVDEPPEAAIETALVPWEGSDGTAAPGVALPDSKPAEVSMDPVAKFALDADENNDTTDAPTVGIADTPIHPYEGEKYEPPKLEHWTPSWNRAFEYGFAVLDWMETPSGQRDSKKR